MDFAGLADQTTSWLRFASSKKIVARKRRHILILLMSGRFSQDTGRLTESVNSAEPLNWPPKENKYNLEVRLGRRHKVNADGRLTDHATYTGHRGAPALSAREVSLAQASDWDEFAQKHGGSIRSSRAFLRGVSLKNFGRGDLRLFELWAAGAETEGRKVGQCAVLMTKAGEAVFLDRLVLAIYEDDGALWSAALRTVLNALGSGRYRYGWELNLEPPRDEHLGRIGGVSKITPTPLTVHAIDFSRFDSWAAYHRAIRKGVRHSAAVAMRDMPKLEISTRKGWQALTTFPALLGLRLALSNRKQLGHRAVDLAASYLGWALLGRDLSVFSVIRNGRKVLAAFFGATFGEMTYYFDGASRRRNGGASWRLVLEMMRRAYQQAPKGKFVMGYVDYAIHDKALSDGLIWSRTACRASEYPTSIVTFQYSA